MANKKKFNKIKGINNWAGWSWNPITGCYHNCQYCYAYDKAREYYTDRPLEERFNPRLWEERLSAPLNTRCPNTGNIRDKLVFVGDMGDIFGDFISDEWLEKVFRAVAKYKQWTYIFLTKNLKRVINIEWPKNTWIGATVDYQWRVGPTEKAFQQIKAPIKFISLEPLMEPVEFLNLDIFDWIIIGGRNETSRMPAGQPKWEWVKSLIGQARQSNVKVFCRPNLTVGPYQKPREFPVELKPLIYTF
jgi:protein gp37